MQFIVLLNGGVLCVCARSLFVCALNWHQKAATRRKDAGRIQIRQTYSAHRTSQERLGQTPAETQPGGDGTRALAHGR